MKFFILILCLGFFASLQAANACSVAPGSEIPLKNTLIVKAANAIYVDIVESDIEVKDFKHQRSWTFTDGGFQCHDTDKMSGTVIFKHKDRFNPDKSCVSKVEVKLVAAPKEKGGPILTHVDMNKLPQECSL